MFAAVIGRHYASKFCILLSSVALLCLFSFASVASAASKLSKAAPSYDIPHLSVDNAVASAGFFRLVWHIANQQVELQESADPAFQNANIIYAGLDQATFVSGKADGVWYYRARTITDSANGQWSEPMAVTVSHHSLARAFMFLSLGVLVFLATLVIIIRGSKVSH